MKWFWLLASIASALMTALFIWLMVYAFLYYPMTWLRALAAFSLVAAWASFTHTAFVKFRR